MSDTEEQGGFDKEAEKEKLREQLQREEENRRSTQHMSELLLKGATMTNKHCDTCGDPLFRYEGREFCPTCARGEGEATAGVGEPPESSGAEGVDGVVEESAGSDRAPAEPGDVGTAPRGTPDAGTHAPPRPTGDGSTDVAAARAALERKLASLAQQAEATDDVGRSRELLAAAREAAEALAAVDGIRG